MKPNYYTIHKNKKPKKIREPFFDPFVAITALTAANGVSQVNMINTMPAYVRNIKEETESAQYNRAVELKKEMMVDAIFKTAKAIAVDIPKQRMLHKFRTTGRYVK